MANTPKFTPVSSPEAILRHNIRVLKSRGWDDGDYIATTLKIPPESASEYGLQCRKSAVKGIDPSVLIEAIYAAVNDNDPISAHELLNDLGTNVNRVRT